MITLPLALKRFSLLTLLLLTLLAGCTLLLWRRAAPWQIEREVNLRLPQDPKTPTKQGDLPPYLRVDYVITPDLHWVLAMQGYENENRGHLRLIDLFSGETKRAFEVTEEIREIAISGDGRRVAASFRIPGEFTPHVMQVWNAETGARIHRFEWHTLYPPGAHTFTADGNAVFADDRLFQFGAAPETFLLSHPHGHTYSMEEQEEFNKETDRIGEAVRKITNLREYVEKAKGAYMRTRLSPSGKWLLTNIESVVQIWDATTERKINELELDWYETIVRFTPNDERIVLMTDDNAKNLNTTIFEIKTGIKLEPFQHHGAFGSEVGEHISTMSSDAKRMVMPSDNTGLVRVLAEIGKEPRAIDYNLKDPFSLSPDGQTLLSCVYPDDGKIYFKRVDANTLQVIGELRHPKGLIHNVAQFSLDGTRILTATEEDELILWHRARPDAWWGLACLPEFWAAAICAAGVVWSLLRDRRL